MTIPVRNFDIACHVAGAVCAHFGVTLAELESPARPERLVWPRFITIGLIRKHTSWPLTTIGDFMGKHHTSILVALKRFENRTETESKARAEVAAVEARL